MVRKPKIINRKSIESNHHSLLSPARGTVWVLQSTWKGLLGASFPEKAVLQLWAAVGHGARGSWHQTAAMAPSGIRGGDTSDA